MAEVIDLSKVKAGVVVDGTPISTGNDAACGIDLACGGNDGGCGVDLACAGIDRPCSVADFACNGTNDASCSFIDAACGTVEEEEVGGTVIVR